MLKIQTWCMFYQRIFMIFQQNQEQVTFQFSTLIFEASKKNLKVSKLISLLQILRSALYVFQRHGVMTWIILYMICQVIQVAIKKGVIARLGESLSTFIILSTSKLYLNFLLTSEILNHLPQKLYLRKHYISVLY